MCPRFCSTQEAYGAWRALLIFATSMIQRGQERANWESVRRTFLAHRVSFFINRVAFRVKYIHFGIYTI